MLIAKYKAKNGGATKDFVVLRVQNDRDRQDLLLMCETCGPVAGINREEKINVEDKRKGLSVYFMSKDMYDDVRVGTLPAKEVSLENLLGHEFGGKRTVDCRVVENHLEVVKLAYVDRQVVRPHFTTDIKRESVVNEIDKATDKFLF